MVGKELMGIFVTAMLFFNSEAHVHLMTLHILRFEPLTLFIAQQLPPHILSNLINLEVQSAISWHLGFLSIIPQCPPRDRDGSLFAEVFKKVLIQLCVQHFEENTGLFVSVLCKL